MELLAFMIFQSGEPFTRGILKRICSNYDLVEIIRRRTDEGFSQKVRHLYEHLDPSKKESVEAKIQAQRDNTSLLIVVCKGDKSKNRLVKDKIRLLVGHNCIHSFDNEKSTVYMLKYLLGIDDLSIDNFRYIKGCNGIRKDVYDFLHKEFVVIGRQKSKAYSKLSDFCTGLVVYVENPSLVIMNIGPTVNTNIKAGKDIDIITSNRTRLVDELGATYRKGESVYHVTINDAPVKVDFSMSVDIPVKWRNHILATKAWNAKEGFYQPQDVDIFWLHIYDRTILKPHKFKSDKRYGKGAKHNDLIAMGKWLGITPTIKEKDDVETCAKAVKQYLKRI